MTDIPEYGLLAYGRMLGGTDRTDAYARAIAAAVRPGDVVVVAGSGIGLFALLACRAGAAKVYAIEAGSVAEVARRIVQQNGLSDRIEVIRKNSLEVTLPQPADVLLADLRGVLPLAGPSLVVMFDARDRFLRPEGRVVPAVDVVMGAVVAAPARYAEVVGAWDERYGFDFSAAREVAAQLVVPASPGEVRPVSEPSIWTAIDYARQQAASVRGTMTCEVRDGGVVHGLALWFESTLAPGVTLSTAPDSRDQVYGQAFLPWPAPLDLSVGDEVTTDLRADLVEDSYVWTWHTIVRSGGRACEFRQSTFKAAALPPVW